MNRYMNSKWTSVNKKHGWRHYEVKNIAKKKRQLELFAVCDQKINVIVKVREIEDRRKWYPGWLQIV